MRKRAGPTSALADLLHHRRLLRDLRSARVLAFLLFLWGHAPVLLQVVGVPRVHELIVFAAEVHHNESVTRPPHLVERPRVPAEPREELFRGCCVDLVFVVIGFGCVLCLVVFLYLGIFSFRSLARDLRLGI